MWNKNTGIRTTVSLFSSTRWVPWKHKEQQKVGNYNRPQKRNITLILFLILYKKLIKLCWRWLKRQKGIMFIHNSCKFTTFHCKILLFFTMTKNRACFLLQVEIQGTWESMKTPGMQRFSNNNIDDIFVTTLNNIST